MIRQDCTRRCSLYADNLPGTMGVQMHRWFEAGDSQVEIRSKMLKYTSNQVKISYGAIGRHKSNHLVRIIEDPNATSENATSDENATLAKVNHLELLEQIISRGAKGIPFAKVSPEMALKAMELHNRLTQGSAVAATMDAITAAMVGNDDDYDFDTNPQAASPKDEIAQADVSD